MLRRTLGKKGRLVNCGGTSGPIVTTDVRRMFWNQWSLLGSTMGSESEFCAYTGCSPANLEHWLSCDWVQHFPNLVLSLEDLPGPVPWVLYRTQEGEHSVRVFSASEDLVDVRRRNRILMELDDSKGW